MTKSPLLHRWLVMVINGATTILPSNSTLAYPGANIRYVSAHDCFGEAAIAAMQVAAMTIGR